MKNRTIMKRILAASLAAVVASTAAGCGNKGGGKNLNTGEVQ